MPIRNVKTRWNSSDVMMERGLILRKAIDAWVFECPNLRPLLLSDRDWETIGHLHRLLEVC
ncbi:hypothetical protein OF83DRAFT_1045834, partial [Amylostereum chailletii]